MTTRSGSATEDALCGGPIDQGLISSQNFTYKTYTRSQASSDTTTLYTMTSGTITSTTDEGANESDESSMVVILAVIICVISLLIAFFLAWKQKMCNLKLWKYFIHPGASGVPQKTVIPSMTENMEDLLKKGNDGPLEDQHLIQPGRDQMNNRIEKIYIMNADTVLVGSVSEVPTCWRSVTTECDGQERGPLESHYPVQESSKLSANDLMISIEEEERESCAAKALLEV
ncbi:hypothetical protein GDO81_013961 [Engystomops pustulosus]|uniref:Uncharacterized protein n=1 Tax=Engystomops pustulosus TaxID=76066 RepID=A0AAV7B6Y0_ENGPU|nr:hypothetical protein GDO81_013961 [Engystomops pustulosus]